MKRSTVDTRENVLAKRQISRDFRLDLLRGLQSTEYSNITSESNDCLMSLPHARDITPRRILRSQGPVDNLPNVQQQTLEYELARHHK